MYIERERVFDDRVHLDAPSGINSGNNIYRHTYTKCRQKYVNAGLDGLEYFRHKNEIKGIMQIFFAPDLFNDLAEDRIQGPPGNKINDLKNENLYEYDDAVRKEYLLVLDDIIDRRPEQRENLCFGVFWVHVLRVKSLLSLYSLICYGMNTNIASNRCQNKH